MVHWFHDKDDAQPLPSTSAPGQAAQPLDRGLRNKTTSQFLDAVAREQLGSDEENLTARGVHRTVLRVRPYIQRSGDGYGSPVHRPSSRVSKGPTATGRVCVRP